MVEIENAAENRGKGIELENLAVESIEEGGVEQVVGHTQQALDEFQQQAEQSSDDSIIRLLASLLADDEGKNPVLCPNRTVNTVGLTTEGNSTVNVITTNNDTMVSSSPVFCNDRLHGYFVSDTVFNLSKKVLSDTEIRVLSKGLSFVPTPSAINEMQLRDDFAEFSRRMRCRWYFRNEVSEDFGQVPSFRKKSEWNPPMGHPELELYLSKVEKELFDKLPGIAHRRT